MTPTITSTATNTGTATQTSTITSTVTQTATITPTVTLTATPTATATPAPANGSAQYYYDGNGTMVKSVIDNIITYYPSSAYQVKTDGTHTNTRKYYSFGGSVVAMRENPASSNGAGGTVTWLLQDQVSSTTITANADGSLASEVRYSAFGEVRYTSGATVTDKLYTGQQQETEIGLDYYASRFYDPVIAHFVQMDSLIPNPGDSKSFDRYSYVENNPISFNDPTGKSACWDDNRNDPHCQGKIVNASGIVDRNSNNTVTPPASTLTTQWVIVCGINYACTGNQNGKNPSYDLPAFPGWQKEIEKIPGNSVTFVPTTKPSSNYSVMDYSSVVQNVIKQSSADNIILVCHSRGGQVCTNIAHDADSRISWIILLEPSVRSGETDTEAPYDSIGDYNKLFDPNNKYKTALIVSRENLYPEEGIGKPVKSFPNLDHNGLVYSSDVLNYILALTSKGENK